MIIDGIHCKFLYKESRLAGKYGVKQGSSKNYVSWMPAKELDEGVRTVVAWREGTGRLNLDILSIFDHILVQI